ncbi:MAG: hypothetical protein ACI9NT_001890 [Bacteroidia bacterium]|jgi:hypothetical protein
MRKVFTHENRIIVGNARNILEDAGMDVILRNEFASGGMGETSPLETWPEVWVLEDERYEEAVEILQSALSDKAEPGWTCGGCGEQNGAAFEFCWSCQIPRSKE